MKVAINSLPLKNAHKYRGIGYYTSHLLEALKRETSVEVLEFTGLKDVKDADVIHYPWFDLFFHTLPIIKRFPTVVTIHDVIPLVFPENYRVGLKGKINFILQRIALSNCRCIITDSETSREDIIKYLKVDDKKITVIPLAAGSEFKVLSGDTQLLRIKRRFRLPDRFLLYVGDANWVKNLPFLIKSFWQLLKYPGLGDIKLVLAGRVFLKDVRDIDHPELQSLKLVNQLIKEYRLEDFIIKPGQIETAELAAFYNLATVYVQPSVYEGFGLPVLQAFACGTPVVSSNRGSLHEIGGEAAVYFNPTDLSQLVSILRELLGNRSLRSKLSKLGLRQAAKFSFKKVAADTGLVYLRAMNK